MFRSSLVIAAFVALMPLCGFAQILPREDSQSDTGLEDLYEKFEEKEVQTTQRKKAKAKAQEEKADKEAQKEATRLSELVDLAPFENIAVIQKRFLPKLNRFEVSGSGMVTTNNAFFNTFGLAVNLAFFFNETFGVEGTYAFMTSSERPITEGLVDNQNIDTRSLVQPESFYTVSLKWSPIYGKMAWFQQKIVPFDFYFTPGFGMSQTANGTSEPTLHLGMGQLFALSKSYGVRWDFSWNYYQADVEVTTNNVTTTETKNHSDLILGIGVSFFFPEATYR